MLKRFSVILFLGLIAAATLFAVQQYLRWHEQPLPLHELAEPAIIVPPGEPLGRLAERLERDGVIEHAWEMKLLARLRGDAGNIRAGEYVLEPGITLAGLLDKLVAGRVRMHSLTIVEGATAAQLFEQLAAHPAIRRTLEDYEYETVAQALELEGAHPEGWFLPETYRFPRGTTDVEFLRRAHEAMRRVLETAWENRASNLPLNSPYEVLILASIIEKETSIESERRTIAGVFSRRLQRGMRLQTDPTVIYGIPNFDGNIRRRDLLAWTGLPARHRRRVRGGRLAGVLAAAGGQRC
jgi:UPF0755 protein